jgi:hypothetical protein
VSGSTPFRLEIASAVLDDIRVLALRAARKGLLDPLTASLRKMTAGLATDPVAWGDPLFDYPSVHWRLYQRGIGPLYIAYAVDETHKIVYVKLVRPFPSGGLESVP